MAFDLDTITSDHHPDSNMIQRDYDKYIILMGSLSSMMRNKHINQTALIIHLLDDKPIQTLFLKIIGVNTLQELVLILLHRYPRLCTSKTVSNYVRSNNDHRRR